MNEGELAGELREGLTLKSGLYHFHPLQGQRGATFSLRCHVAMPFVQSRVSYLEDGEKIRTDEMRRAFNTPFWPTFSPPRPSDKRASIFTRGATPSCIGTCAAILSILSSGKGASKGSAVLPSGTPLRDNSQTVP